jgi:hypothetical protein
MKEIGKNNKLLSKLTGENCLLDTKIEHLSIFAADNLIIEITFLMRPKSDFERVTIRFSGVLEYSFYYNTDYIFYNVERYKFFLDNNNNFYLSLDPFNEAVEISDQDQDYIIAKEVVGMEFV